MPNSTKAASITFGLLLAAPPAFADLTGADVWADWKSYMGSFGYDVTATESERGDRLDVSEITMTSVLPDGAGTVALTLDGITFETNSDGTVDIDLPARMPLAFNVVSETGENASGTFVITQDGQTMTASGDADNLTYTYSATQIAAVLEDLVAEGRAMPADAFGMTMNIRDMAGSTEVIGGEPRGYDQTVSMAEVAFELNFQDPDRPSDSGTMSGQIMGLQATSLMSLPENMDSSDMGLMLEQGLKLDSTMTFAAGASAFTGVSAQGSSSATGTSGPGEISVKMGEGGLSYDIDYADVKAEVQVPNFPVPVSFTSEQTQMNIGFPIAKSEEPEDFALGVALRKFTISDVIWNLFDPAGQLPRDPATLVIDLAGKAKILADLTTANPAAGLGGPVNPAELHALNIKELELSAIGADLTGEGSFTFDNSDMVTFNGMPRPVGEAKLRLTGANALLDKLVQLGLLPEAQAMSARMMMAFIAVPDGEDSMTSTLAITPEGGITANGQRIR